MCTNALPNNKSIAEQLHSSQAFHFCLSTNIELTWVLLSCFRQLRRHDDGQVVRDLHLHMCRCQSDTVSAIITMKHQIRYSNGQVGVRLGFAHVQVSAGVAE